METRIASEINRLQREREIKIILACETGSRAWGFPSPDSDYDVRIIYMHSGSWYMSVFEGKDTIEYMSDDGEIDLTGWELRKSLRLLYKSNPPLLERLQSPIIYQEDEAILEGLRSLVPKFYSRRASLHHYLNMGMKISKTLNDANAYKLKAFFYSVRAACACRWIFRYESPPPIVFKELYEGLELDPALVKRIQELVTMKASISEAYMHTGDEELLRWIGQSFDEASLNCDELPVSNGDVKIMDRFLNDSCHDA